MCALKLCDRKGRQDSPNNSKVYVQGFDAFGTVLEPVNSLEVLYSNNTDIIQRSVNRGSSIQAA